MPLLSCLSPSLIFPPNLWGPVTRTGGQNIVPTYKPTEAQSSYVQLLEAQIKSANCGVKKISESNLNVKLESSVRGAF